MPSSCKPWILNLECFTPGCNSLSPIRHLAGERQGDGEGGGTGRRSGRVMGEEGDGSAPLSHSTFHESHHPADTNFSSSLASGTIFFFFSKVSDEATVFTAGGPAALFCSAPWTARWGWDRGPRRDLEKGTWSALLGVQSKAGRQGEGKLGGGRAGLGLTLGLGG